MEAGFVLVADGHFKFKGVAQPGNDRRDQQDAREVLDSRLHHGEKVSRLGANVKN